MKYSRYPVVFFIFICITFLQCQSQNVYSHERLLHELGISDLLQASGSFLNGTCTFKTGENGNCVTIDECVEITKYVDFLGFGRKITEFLRGRICKIEEGQVFFCCIPETLPTPTNTTEVTEPDEIVTFPDIDECGFTYDDRIILGDETKHGQQPWLVGIGERYGDDQMDLVCGGTLITKRHVLSASHCFDGFFAPEFVVLGEHSIANDTEVEKPIVMRIASRVNPGFVGSTFKGDIELLTLERDVNFTDYIRPACLPFNMSRELFDNTTMTITGWGTTKHGASRTTDIPLQGKLPVVSQEECQRAYNDTEKVIAATGDNDFGFTQLDDTQICAGYVEQDTCQGDSGGPLIFFEEENYFRNYVVGVVSFGIGCAHKDFPGIYTYVPAYLDWIQEQIQTTQ